jgi:hypothetical protein
LASASGSMLRGLTGAKLIEDGASATTGRDLGGTGRSPRGLNGALVRSERSSNGTVGGRRRSARMESPSS